MTVAVENIPNLGDLLARQAHVLSISSALGFMSRAALRWRVSSGRWQQPCRGIVVAHSGPLTEEQRLWACLLAAGRGAALAGLTAARLDGLRGFPAGEMADRPIYLLVPAGQRPRGKLPGPSVVVHYSTLLGDGDVHPLRLPRRTRIARSLVDAAAWMPTSRGAQAVLAAGVQQRLVRVDQLGEIVAANQRLRQRRVIAETLADIAGGAQALSELDFTRLVVRAYHLPEPDRQVRRKDANGRNRYLDAVWERHKVVVEIDGSQHMDPGQHWDDMERDIDLQLAGYEVLRFPAWLVRYNPGHVAAKVRVALANA